MQQGNTRLARFDVSVGWRHIGVVLALGWIMAISPAVASAREIDPGETVALQEDEGLLVVAVDSSMDGRLFSSGLPTNLKAGRTSRLYAVPAGTYEWDTVRLFASLHTTATSSLASATKDARSAIWSNSIRHRGG